MKTPTSEIVKCEHTPKPFRTACNAHDDLLSACKAARDWIYNAGIPTGKPYDPYSANMIIANLQNAIDTTI